MNYLEIIINEKLRVTNMCNENLLCAGLNVFLTLIQLCITKALYMLASYIFTQHINIIKNKFTYFKNIVL